MKVIVAIGILGVALIVFGAGIRFGGQVEIHRCLAGQIK